MLWRLLIELFVVGVFLWGALLAQSSLRSVERHYYRGEFLTLAGEPIDLDQVAPRKLLYYASAYYQLGERERAYQAYQKAFEKLSLTEVEHNFLTECGRLYLEYENPDQALELFNQALQRTAFPDSQKLLSQYIAYATQLKNYHEPPPQGHRWVAYNLGRLNTPAHEYSLFIHKGRLYFISRRDAERGQDPEDLLPHEALYWTQVGDSSPRPIGFFPKKHEGIAGFVGDTLVLYRSARRRGDFYIAYPAGESWQEPIPWKAFPNSRKGSEDALCQDPRTGDILFSSDRKGTLGGKDLWVTRRLPSGKFSPPENLSALNSPYNEDAPFIAGDTLYFAHDGPGSLGGYDLYYSVRQPGGWSKPVRLPRPFNSPAHDSYLFFTHPDSVYLSSARVGGRGRMDLWLLVKQPVMPPAPPPVAEEPRHTYRLNLRTVDARAGQPLRAQVLIRPADGTPLQGQTDPNGQFQQEKPPAGTYLAYVWADGYATAVTPLSVPEAADLSQEIALLPEKDLRTLRLPRLHFNFDKYSLRREAPQALDTVMAVLRRYPSLVIEVAGHTDGIGTRNYNQALSRRRANTVYEYLIKQGIAAERLQYRGYGEDRPLVPNDTPYHRFLNRRVEFVPLVGRPPELK